MEQFEREGEIQIPKFYSYTSKNICIQPTGLTTVVLYILEFLDYGCLLSFTGCIFLVITYGSPYWLASWEDTRFRNPQLCPHYLLTINMLDHHFLISACGRFASTCSDIRRFSLTIFTLVVTQCGETVSRWSPTGLFLAGWSWSKCWPPAPSSRPSLPSFSRYQSSSGFPSRSSSG